jgi:hypothetical protein
MASAKLSPHCTMSTSFAFIPRKLVKKQVQFPPVPVSKGEEPEPESEPPPTKTTTGIKAKATHSDEDHVIFVFLALSDHALWSNPDLSRKIEDNNNGGEEPGCTSPSLSLVLSVNVLKRNLEISRPTQLPPLSLSDLRSS